jgi:hypothetical protein
MTTHFPYFNKKWRVKIFPLCQIYKIVICPCVLVSFFFWPLYCISSFDIRLLVTPVVSSNCWPLYCISSFDIRLLVTPVVSSNFWPLYCISSFDIRLLVTPVVSSNFWPLHCISSFDIRLLVTPVVSSNFWPLHCMYFFELRRLITPSVSSTFSINIVHRDMKRESLNSDCQQLHRRQNEQSPLTLTKLTACRYLPVFNLTTPMWTMLKKYMINGKKK